MSPQKILKASRQWFWGHKIISLFVVNGSIVPLGTPSWSLPSKKAYAHIYCKIYSCSESVKVILSIHCEWVCVDFEVFFNNNDIFLQIKMLFSYKSHVVLYATAQEFLYLVYAR